MVRVGGGEERSETAQGQPANGLVYPRKARTADTIDTQVTYDETGARSPTFRLGALKPFYTETK